MTKEKKKEVGIKALTIQIGSREIEVTPEEAKDLYQALNRLYGERTRTEYIPYTPSPYPWWNKPIYWGASYGNVSLKAQPDSLTSNVLTTPMLSNYQTQGEPIDYTLLADHMNLKATK